MSPCLAVVAVLILLSARATLNQIVEDSAPVVQTDLGKIQGSILKSQHGSDIYAFRGIHYAKAPEGELRFAAPEPVEPWSETLKATGDSLICPQTGIKLLMTENCLTLNVYSKNLTGKSPVMVYIHGGANVLGSGHSLYEAGPQYLLDHDIVLVAFNYRLGALGFLSTGTEKAPGNYGYLDQVLVLMWIQNHISNFGGDSNVVTIFGVSAGAMAVTLHMASPLSKGLFHRAIAMSGSATNHFSIDNKAWTRKLARELSCPMYNPEDVVNCLRNVSWQNIIDVCSKWEPYSFTNMKWNYEVDGQFLLMHPSHVFLSGNHNQVPVLAGFTKNELDFSVYHQENNTGLLNDISINFDLYAPELFLYNGTAEERNSEKSDEMKKFYLRNTSMEITKENLEEFGEIFSDGIIGHGVHRLVELAQRYSPVFYYRMDYIGQRSLYSLNDERKPRGVGHADDLQYVMPSLWYGAQISLDHPDMFMVDRITTWWTSFAKYGAPMSELENQWEPTSYNKTITLYNNKETSMGLAPYQDRYQLWDNMFPISSTASRIKIFCISALIVVKVMLNII